MKFEGITGESEVEGFQGFIEVQSFSWGCSRALQNYQERRQFDFGEANVQSVHVVKTMDGSSVPLCFQAMFGKLDHTVELHFVRTGPGTSPQVYAIYKLEMCGIAEYSVASGGSHPVESISLSFGKISFTHFKFDDKLRPIPDSMQYSLPQATGSRG